MKFYISTTGIKKLTISNNGKGSAPTTTAAAARRVSIRTVLPVVLFLGIVLSFLFVRVAFLVLESASASSSSIDCIGWGIFSGSDTSLGEHVKYVNAKDNNFNQIIDHIYVFIVVMMHVQSKRLKEELNRALLEAKEGSMEMGGVQSFDQLVEEVTSKTDDIKAFASMTKAMLSQMERQVQSARQRESIYWHLASHGIPKSLHCLLLKLAAEYAANAMARSRLPSPEYASRVVDPSLHHLVLLTDNVLAASVVVSSTIQNSANPGRLVFHIVTDKKTFTSMHAWFAINSMNSAVVEVKGLHQYYWSRQVNADVKEMMEIHRLTWKRYYNSLKEDIKQGKEHNRSLEALNPSSLSLMNHLRVFIPEMFPDLNKILFVDDDIVVQRDISSLWELDINGKVIGAVFNTWCGVTCCPGGKFMDHLNFSNLSLSSSLIQDHCSWLYGVNVFDLEAWRRTKITAKYLQWLKLNLKSGLTLWNPGALPPALVAFDGHVHPIDPSFVVPGLGSRSVKVSPERLEAASVIHFSGPAKPWMEIGFPEVRSLWNVHVNFSDKFIRRCRVTR